MIIRILLLILPLALAACDRQDARWEQAQQEDTIAAYESFIERYPESPEAEQARSRIEALRAEQAWTDARQRNTIGAYREFVESFPDAAAADEARTRLHTLQRETQWQDLAESEDIDALRAFAEEFSGSPEAELAQARVSELEARARAEAERRERERELQRQRERELEAQRLAEQGTHRVQLAVVRGRDQATSGIELLQQRLGEVLGDIGLEAQQTDGLYRLVTGPMDQGRAEELCETLKKRGQDCLVRER
ncbi:MAG: SPOR domain-containing protein [Wenzhouxiangellaceae bacterium]|nr:SPOR domain-containing protein [Wenzhouxiangellaceae bacterium]